MSNQQKYGVYSQERTIVVTHGPNFFNAHKALGIHSPDYLAFRNFFAKSTDLYGFHYFNAVPDNQETHSPIERLAVFLERSGFSVSIKYLGMIETPAAVAMPNTAQPVVTIRRENHFNGNRLSLASSRPEMYLNLDGEESKDDEEATTALAPERKMVRITLTSEVMTKVMRILLLSRARVNAIQRIVFIGGENDYAPWFDLFTELGVRVTVVGLFRESVSPLNTPIPAYAMLPFEIRAGHPVQYVDLSTYLPLIQNEEFERRRLAGQNRFVKNNMALSGR